MSTTEEQIEYDDHIGFDLSSDLKRRVRVAASLENKNISDYLRDLLDEETEKID